MPGDRFIELATAEDRRVLDILFRHASEAVSVQDRTGRLLYANDEAARIVGFRTGAELVATPPEDIVGRFEMIDRAGLPLALESLPGRKVMAGAPVSEAVIGYRRPGSPRARWTGSGQPDQERRGEVVLVLNFFQDISLNSDAMRSGSFSTTSTKPWAPHWTGTRTCNRWPGPWSLEWGHGARFISSRGLLLPVAVVYPDEDDALSLVQVAGSAQSRWTTTDCREGCADSGVPEVMRPDHRGDARAGRGH